MKTLRIGLTVVLATAMAAPAPLFARGFGGGGRGVGAHGGGAQAGGVPHHSMQIHTPSFSHPSAGAIGAGNRMQISGGRPPAVGGAAGSQPKIGVGGIGGPKTGAGGSPGMRGHSNINFNRPFNRNIAVDRPYYNNWHHGYWNGNWNRPWYGGGYWDRPWYGYPLVWGMGAWAVGSIYYDSGYVIYSNPYYGPTIVPDVIYDYSQPIPSVPQPPQSAAPPTEPQQLPPQIKEGTSHVEIARDAFKIGDYTTAMKEIDLALKQLPNDAALHEFRALVLFARKDYPQAAATLYAVLSAGPGWDWTTLSSMYFNNDVYTSQLRDLENYVKAYPNSADANFVLAYHYITGGNIDAAIRRLKDVVRLQPNDQLSAKLLKMLGSESTPDAAVKPGPQIQEFKPVTPEPPVPPEPAAPPEIDAAKVVGKWTAKRADGAAFALDLTAESKFTWTFEQGNRKQTFNGKYKVDGAVLVLERADGATMPGQVTFGPSGFNFKLYGGPPEDPGLDFRK